MLAVALVQKLSGRWPLEVGWEDEGKNLDPFLSTRAVSPLYIYNTQEALGAGPD